VWLRLVHAPNYPRGPASAPTGDNHRFWSHVPDRPAAPLTPVTRAICDPRHGTPGSRLPPGGSHADQGLAVGREAT
jgi:hypothetical protein